MTEIPRIEFDGEDAHINLDDQTQCMQFIRDKVIPGCVDDVQALDGELVMFRKITKNDSIQQTLEKLQAGKSRFVCVYAYGPHIHKLLSVVEIFKKIPSRESEAKVTVRQWNRLSSFVSVQQGKNELLEKRTRVPILITVVARPSDQEPLELSLKGFTQQ